MSCALYFLQNSPAAPPHSASFSKLTPYGIGRSEKVLHAANTDEAIRIALNSEATVAVFVQFPDPNNPRFKLAREKDGHIIPVLDRKILDQKVDGVPVYFAQKTQVKNASWLSSGTKVVTACTPLVVFTGTTHASANETDWEHHERMSQLLEGLRGDQLMPKAGLFSPRFKTHPASSLQPALRSLSKSPNRLGRKLPRYLRRPAKPLARPSKPATTNQVQPINLSRTPILNPKRHRQTKKLPPNSKIRLATAD